MSAKTRSDKNGISVPRPVGYAALIRRHGLNVIPNWHESSVGAGGSHHAESVAGIRKEIYPARYWPGESLGDHLEFALKYDGTNLAILARLFQAIDPNDLLSYLRSKPTGKYARRLWYLFEFLTGGLLPIDDLKRGNYVDLLDTERYLVCDAQRRVRRQRVNNNLLGNPQFCPTVRRSNTLKDYESSGLEQRCLELISSYAPALLKRALSYLYTKETKSSFEIEHLTPNLTRTERFVSLLQMAEHDDFCNKASLIDLQSRIVDARYRDTDYRVTQNYVGQTVAWQREQIHYIAPRPEDLADLMQGLIAMHDQMNDCPLHPVVHAALVAYGFVFLHPFEDGNGRIHRFLIHNILARRGYVPPGIMFPISAAMLKDREAYDASLEAISNPLKLLIDYSLDEEGRMSVHSDTGDLYRYMDMTAQVEALFDFINSAVEVELVEELTFLQNYDRTKRALRDIVDMPDRQIDLFIRFCLQNKGCLSTKKRGSHFSSLVDEEVRQMERAVQEGYFESGQ